VPQHPRSSKRYRRDDANRPELGRLLLVYSEQEEMFLQDFYPKGSFRERGRLRHVFARSSEIDPVLKAKLMPMTMMKAKRVAGDEVWKSLASNEKTRLAEIELQNLLVQRRIIA
jgi:hypothetical protein